MEAVDSRQICVHTPRPWEERAGIVSLDLGRDARNAVAALADRGIIVSYKDTQLRASLHFYNDEYDRLMAALQAI
jgi:selenocysteine lyase/cysteine desulfurase